MLVDSHAHLDGEEFRDDLEEVLARAQAAGVVGIIAVGVDVRSSRRAVELADLYAGVYAAVGIHPHNADQGGRAMSELRRLAQHRRTVAIGEIGLDFYRDLSPRELQREMFERQLELAAELGKPVIVHSRQSHREVMEILRSWARRGGKGGELGVLHCFSGDLRMADEAIGLGFYLSVAGPLTYPQSNRLRQLVTALPLDRLLVETDCPYLPPQAYRGQRNEPAYVAQVVEAVARARGEAADEAGRITAQNAIRLFALPIMEGPFG